MSGKSKRQRRQPKKSRQPRRRKDSTPAAQGMEGYLGPGVIAYLDMLGFSSAVLKRFDRPFLDEVNDVRRAASEVQIKFVPAKKLPYMTVYPTLHFFSDSIALSSMCTQANDAEQAWWAICSTLLRVPTLIQACAFKGWGTRGCIEAGGFLRTPLELIGPPFVTACDIEKKPWTNARVLVGPKLLLVLEQFSRTGDALTGGLVTALVRCEDSLIAVRPVLQGDPFNVAERLTLRLRELREQAPGKDKPKYDWIIEEAATKGASEPPSADDLFAGHKALIDKLEAKVT